ncbi:MAG: cysteine synthase family protein [Chloroflexi bacterium]|nr:cysteine synthase family protein [Chloroflexota bacterium]
MPKLQSPISSLRSPPSTRPALLNCIGNTPLLPLKLPSGASPRVELWGKAEWFNPGGSVKDRAALFIIEDAERRGVLTPDKILLDATSGNTGIAYAMICAAKGFGVELCMPANVSEERKKILRAYGAKLVLTDPLEGSDGAIIKARELAAAYPERYFYADQYNNTNNWCAHYQTTAPEIWTQTQGRITHLVAGIGTGGTLMGCARRLRELKGNIQIVEVEPADELQIIEGLKHIETSIVPGIYDAKAASRKIAVAAEDAYETALDVVKHEGMFVGFSAGAAIYAARELARELDEGVIVCVLPDGGERYLSTVSWE